MGRKQREAVAAELAAVSTEGDRVLVATGRYIGEGFDDARLDTLFLTLPVSWHGTIAQYAGRLHRLYDGKREVRVYDYAARSATEAFLYRRLETLPGTKGRFQLNANLPIPFDGLSQMEVEGRALNAPNHGSQIAEAAAILGRFLRGSDAPAKIAWLLEYQYSPADLSFSALKAADAAKAGVLVHAAERAQCAVHLGIVHIGESGAAEPDFDEYSYRWRWNRYGDYEDDEDEETEDEDESASFTAITAAEKIAARPETFSPVTIVAPALGQIQAERTRRAAISDTSLVHLWTRAAEFLLRRSEVPPEPPSDWSLDVKLACSCPDCRDLQAFALDPAERVHRFRVKKERRQHLHNAIDRHRLDMTHVTERVGSPQTLVCTKDRRTFDRRMKQYGHEIAAMRTLLDLAPNSDAATALSTRMQAAVECAG